MSVGVAYMFRTATAMLKKSIKLTASRIVLMRGLAITVGSRPRRLASKGIRLPTRFATKATASMVKQTTMDTITPTRSMSISLAKLTTAKVTPHKIAVPHSLSRIRGMSR